MEAKTWQRNRQRYRGEKESAEGREACSISVAILQGTKTPWCCNWGQTVRGVSSWVSLGSCLDVISPVSPGQCVTAGLGRRQANVCSTLSGGVSCLGWGDLSAQAAPSVPSHLTDLIQYFNWIFMTPYCLTLELNGSKHLRLSIELYVTKADLNTNILSISALTWPETTETTKW